MANSQAYDVAIIGGGIAGLSVALHLPGHMRVALFTKGQLGESNTRYAQGGLTAAFTLQVRQTLYTPLLMVCYWAERQPIAGGVSFMQVAMPRERRSSERLWPLSKNTRASPSMKRPTLMPCLYTMGYVPVSKPSIKVDNHLP